MCSFTFFYKYQESWWRHQKVTGEFLAQRPVTRSFDVFLDLNGRVNTGEAGDLRRHRAHYDATLMIKLYLLHRSDDVQNKDCT